jgi:hypothetical protein
VKTLTSQLQSFTNGVRRALVAERASQLLALSLGAILTLIALDFALRLPAVIRVAELALLCGWAASWVWWKLVPRHSLQPTTGGSCAAPRAKPRGWLGRCCERRRV